MYFFIPSISVSVEVKFFLNKYLLIFCFINEFKKNSQ